MKHSLLTLCVFFVAFFTIAQDEYIEEIKNFQENLNEKFKNPDDTPLLPKDLKKFESLDFFPIDSTYCVKAVFRKSEIPKTFEMETTTQRRPVYDRYGFVFFYINGKRHRLAIYQSHDLRESEEYSDHLFIPFNDETNGDETYGGGRYIDVTIPKNDTITIDFNKAYNPYCVYNHNYSCPIPPRENDLDIRIEAGVKKWE